MNDELKRNIYGGGVNRSNKENILDLQLFSSVSSPYTFTLDGDYTVSANIIKPQLVDLSWYARDNISNYQTVTSIPQSNLNYLNSGLYASNMESMFDSCKKLTIIPKLNIDTSKVTDMSGMFSSCSSLTSLDLSNLDTSNVTYMIHMFYGCSSLTSLDVSNFNTSKVTDMRGMFYNCSNLSSINGIIDMKSCPIYSAMFKNCSKLKGVKIKNPPAGFRGEGLSSSQYTIVS